MRWRDGVSSRKIEANTKRRLRGDAAVARLRARSRWAFAPRVDPIIDRAGRGVRVVGDGVDLGAVAGGDQHGLAATITESAEHIRERVPGNRYPLPHADGRGLVVEAYGNEAHRTAATRSSRTCTGSEGSVCRFGPASACRPRRSWPAERWRTSASGSFSSKTERCFRTVRT